MAARPCRKGPHQGPRTAARRRRQSRPAQRQQAADHRRSVSGVKRHCRRLHPRRGEKHRRGGGTRGRLSDLSVRRPGRSASRHADVVEAGEQLFRRESARIVTVLTRIFGFENLALAEDVAQDVFCRALEVWKLRGVPENPSAWLMKAAKNRAIDLLRRQRTTRNIEPELQRLVESEWTLVPTINHLFSAEAIKDDQLRMM